MLKLLSFCIHFVCELYAFYCRFVFILYVITPEHRFRFILYPFCIHFVCVLKLAIIQQYFAYNSNSKWIQNERHFSIVL